MVEKHKNIQNIKQTLTVKAKTEASFYTVHGSVFQQGYTYSRIGLAIDDSNSIILMWTHPEHARLILLLSRVIRSLTTAGLINIYLTSLHHCMVISASGHLWDFIRLHLGRNFLDSGKI